MCMESKVISFRIDDDLLEYLPVKSVYNRYPNRSDIINAALRVAVEWKKHHVNWLGLGFSPKFGDVVDKLEFEYHREHK